ncbi:hypothetical protein ACNFCJ_07840 [Pseudomonas sp. NY15364]|uniref:hypothetical protein n=1 Tax=Pseudomonas sp. NY15364 TaxID=3400353 RepID=UPI003A8BFFE5
MSRLSNTPLKQRGDILLESLIGIVLMAIVGLGLVYSASRVAVSQKDMNQQNIVVSQMRALLQQQGRALCSGSTPSISIPPNESIELTVHCSDAPTTVTVGSLAVDVGSGIRWISLETAAKHNGRFGGPIRVGDAQ